MSTDRERVASFEAANEHIWGFMKRNPLHEAQDYNFLDFGQLLNFKAKQTFAFLELLLEPKSSNDAMLLLH